VRSLVIVALLVAVPATASAAPCTLDAVAAEVGALGGPALDRIAVHVEVGEREGSVTYVMASGDVVGPRVVKASSCRELAKSLALVIVMSWRSDEPAAIEPAAVAPPIAVADPVPEPLAIETRLAPSPPPRHLAVALGAAMDTTGRPALVAGARWRRGAFSVALELHLTAPQSLDVGDGGSVRVTQNALDALPCVHESRYALCGLATAGLIGGQGRKLANATHVYRPTLSLGARVEASFPIHPRLGFRLHLDATQALTSTQFSVDEMTVWSNRPRELWLGGGVVAVFP
jgi:hypothetical protein